MAPKMKNSVNVNKIDKLKQSNVFIAAENTWRGIVDHMWLYSQILLKVYGAIRKLRKHLGVLSWSSKCLFY